ncbi:MAG: isoprenylcysteine carboxylmethyltransferase family protein [Verrucomicrobia bacterium]|nr:isoprenylcysteine carboxylmethyltransferase family protein [Verrucomicrobiota bacterium]
MTTKTTSDRDPKDSGALPQPAAIRRVAIFRHRGLVGALLMTPIVLVVLTSPPLVREDAISGQVLNIFGWLCFLAYAGIRIWATLFIGGRKNDVLQVDGPYSVCRNPLYVGSMCFALSIAFFLKSLTFGAALLVAFFYYWRFVVPAEEKFLESRFGEEFRDYCRRTPRFWPRLSAYHSPRSVAVDMKFLRIEARRLARGVIAPVILLVVMKLRGESWWPEWFQLP